MQVNFLTKIVGLKPGPDLHKKLTRVLGGEEEGADILDEEKARQLARAQNARSQVGSYVRLLVVISKRIRSRDK